MVYSLSLIVGHVTLKTRSLGQIVRKQFSGFFQPLFGPILIRHGQNVYLDDLQFKFDFGSHDLEN